MLEDGCVLIASSLRAFTVVFLELALAQAWPCLPARVSTVSYGERLKIRGPGLHRKEESRSCSAVSSHCELLT